MTEGRKSMRITQSMMINNMIYWTSKQAEKLYEIQTEVAAGKQINKPSDDPAAVDQILVDRSTISAYGQYESNISQALIWIEASETTLEAIDTLAQSAQDYITDQTITQESAHDQLEYIYQQILDYAGAQFGSSYLYSGNQSGTVPFSDDVFVSGGTAADIVYALAEDASDVSIEITNSTGDIVRTVTVPGGGIEGTNTGSWDGCDDGGNPLGDGEYDFTVTALDSAGDAVAAYAAYRGDYGGKQVIIGEGSSITLNNDGDSLFSELLKALSQAITALEDANYDADLMSQLGAAVGDAIDQITAERVVLSNSASHLETTSNRLDRLTMAVEERISDVEVGSTEEAAIKLQAQETTYAVTLEAAAAVLKLSKLSDYI